MMFEFVRQSQRHSRRPPRGPMLTSLAGRLRAVLGVPLLGQKGLGHMRASIHLGTLANTTRPPAMQLAQSSHSTPTRLWFCSVVKHE